MTVMRARTARLRIHRGSADGSKPLYQNFEVPFEDGLKKVQEECQAKMDLPRG